MANPARLVELALTFQCDGPGKDERHTFVVRAARLHEDLDLRVAVSGGGGTVEGLSPSTIEAIRAGIETTRANVNVEDLDEEAH